MSEDGNHTSGLICESSPVCPGSPTSQVPSHQEHLSGWSISPKSRPLKASPGQALFNCNAPSLIYLSDLET